MRKFRSEEREKIFLEILKYLAFFCASVFAVYVIEFFYFNNDFTLTNEWLKSHSELFFVGVVIIMATMVLLYAISCRFLISIFIPTAIFGIFGYANKLKLIYRNEPVLPEELSYLFNLKELLSFVTSRQLFLIILSIIALVIGIFAFVKFTKKSKLTFFNRFLCGTISFYIIYSYINYHGSMKYFNLFYFLMYFIFSIIYLRKLLKIGKSNLEINKHLETFKLLMLLILTLGFLVLWNSNLVSVSIRKYSMYPEGYFDCSNYREDSVLTGFITFNFKEIVAKPKDYDLQSILEKYTQKAINENENRDNIQEDSPNIIILMSESFSDMNLINNLKMEKNPLEVYDMIAKNNANGSTYAKGVGGSTNTSEYEVITGFDTYNYNYKNVFSMVGKNESYPSIVSTLENIGYESATIHFNNPTFYARDKGYEALGFDSFYSNKNYDEIKYIAKSPYADDKSNFELVYKLIEENDSPMIIHDVTIQNHGPYSSSYFDKLTNKVVGLTNHDDDEASAYATGIEISSKELSNLLNKLEDFDEPTIVLFFGDHLPYFYGESNFEDRPYITKNQVPYLLFSNFEGFEKDENLVGMSFLYSKIFSMGNYKTTPFNIFMEELNEKVEVIANGGVFTSIDTFVPLEDIEDEELLQLLTEYQAIMYDTSEGSQQLFKKGFFDIIE